MSKERQKARAVREAERRAEVEAAAERREREARSQVRKEALKRKVTPVVGRRRRRYGALPTLMRVQMAMVFVAVQVVGTLFIDSLGPRVVLVVLTAAVLAVFAATRRSPPR